MTEDLSQRKIPSRDHKASEIARRTSKCAPATRIDGLGSQLKPEPIAMARPIISNPINVSRPAKVPGRSSPHIRVEGSVVQRRPCKQTCLCQCHKVTSSASSDTFNSVLGRLFISYVGLPLLSYRKCNHVACQNHQSVVGMRIRIAYLFPLWFALKLWALTIWKTSTTFMWKLDFPVITQTAAPVYVAASLGDIAELQTLLGSNFSLLNAIDATANKSPLQVALQFRQVTVVSLLLRQGAEMHSQDCNKNLELRWTHITRITSRPKKKIAWLICYLSSRLMMSSIIGIPPTFTL